jgi:broad specificity phosphatase PhoE
MSPHRLYLVRHGEAAAGWGDDVDPRLSDTGRAQAEAMAAALAERGPLPVVVSPLRRTRETAAALERAWGTTARVDPAVGEIPSPTDDLAGRMSWLGSILPMPMQAWPADLQSWRRSIVDALLALEEDTVVVTHFVAIRSVVDDDAFQPDYCSITTVDSADGCLTPVELGAQRATVIR